jgi:transposase
MEVLREHIMNTERRHFLSDVNVKEERRTYPTDFKVQVALAAIKGEKSHAELAMQFAIHPNQISLWKQQTLNNLNRVFDNDYAVVEIESKTNNDRHAKIGQLMAENDFLTKVLGR